MWTECLASTFLFSLCNVLFLWIKAFSGYSADLFDQNRKKTLKISSHWIHFPRLGQWSGRTFFFFFSEKV